MQCDLAGRLARTDGGAGAGEVLRDQLGAANQQAKQLSQMSRCLEEMPNTRAKLEAGEITLPERLGLGQRRPRVRSPASGPEQGVAGRSRYRQPG